MDCVFLMARRDDPSIKSFKNQDPGLTTEEFRAVIKSKGWTYVELAARWGVTPEWIGVLSRNPDRPAHYNDAVLALPSRRFFKQDTYRRRELVRKSLQRTASLLNCDKKHAFPINPGDVLVAMEDVGSMAYEGDRAVVVVARSIKEMNQYGILFPRGDFDWFWQPDVDHYLAETGLEEDDFKSYIFSTEDQLKCDFSQGVFNFRHL